MTTQYRPSDLENEELVDGILTYEGVNPGAPPTGSHIRERFGRFAPYAKSVGELLKENKSMGTKTMVKNDKCFRRIAMCQSSSAV